MNGKTALITGASRGIGRAVAIELARRGAAVAVNYLSSEHEAVESCDIVKKSGGTARPFKADISRPGEVETLFSQVIDHFGGIDILVNNAGIMINTPIDQVSEEEFDRVFSINVKGVFFCCRQAALKMNQGGRIVNIGTSVTRAMLPFYGTYAASKGAVEQLTRVLAKELGPRDITVNTVSPGPTDTELFRRGKDEAQVAALAGMSAFNRIALPD
ncbi:MAG: SDR family NAD(P)-dependent oxidoreductase, partial [Desulfocapsaceae bacterium]|nr:SDR family NAD(P)-dependent oxidoreductase [Desulfocapsaceae bacterium]